ncbi:ribonuclease E/G [Limibaculum sp. M0105]|uniref:Ribonuclease E/G n=1 Tax=Thermohalobaculum xanthum TaxID=2753746 RepID=A0A8J7M5E5_9RHOB|nr:ribonuclease E/G [Thermohalobaculum xanthum]MBK0398100.1 ribonuclease E/G [Thermohalobaculum xanthum]
MSHRTILIETHAHDGRTRAALVVDGRLEDLLIDPPGDAAAPRPGEIYRARVDRLVPNAGGAFMRLDRGRQGYLREARGLREGQRLLVMATGHAEPHKATPVTQRLLFKARHAILTPGAPGINVSRQIRDEDERARLTAVATEALGEAGDTGLILRSLAAGAEPDAIRADIAALRALAADAAETAEGPVPGTAASARRTALSEWEGRVEEGAGLFEREGVLDEIDRLLQPQANLASGAWMTIEPTAALVAVDINTGGDFSAAAGLKANLDAARDLPRQLRLRGLGGQIVVDFAPMPKKDRKRIEDTLKSAFRRDPIETSLAGWTGMGLFEIQRKRERQPLAEVAD